MHELLVEHLPEPPELDRIAQLGGVDHLVELGGVDVIGRLVAAVLAAPGRPTGASRAILSALALDFHLGLARRLLGAIVLAGLALLAFHGRDRLGLFRLAALALLALRLVLLVAFALGLLLGRIRLLDAEIDVEIGEQLAYRLGVGPLVAHQLDEVRQVLSHLVVDRRPPQLHQPARAGRRRRAGHRLAGQEPHGGGKLARLALGQALIAALAALLVQRRRQVLGHAGHGPRADRLDPRQLDGVEHGTRRVALGRHTRIHLGVVVAQLEGDRIRLAAHLGDLLARQLARQHGQPRFASGDAVLARREDGVELRLVRDGAHRRAGHPPELLDPVLALAHGRLGGSCGQTRVALAPESLSSVPMARW